MACPVVFAVQQRDGNDAGSLIADGLRRWNQEGCRAKYQGGKDAAFIDGHLLFVLKNRKEWYSERQIG
jgi:hypothetical protein